MDFFFREYGKGTPIIILHGWLGISDHWINIGKYLSSQGFNVIIPDLPNHGRSLHTEEFSFNEMAEILHSFIKAKRLRKPILMGHSMGGKVAMKMVSKNPKSYRALVLIDIHPRRYSPNIVSNKLITLLREINISQINSLREFRNYFINANIEKEWVAILLKNLYTTKKELLWRSNIPVLVRDYDKVLEKIEIANIKTPTLLIKGQVSSYIMQDDEHSFKDIFLCSKIVEVQNAGHWVQVDNPAQMLKEIMEFLSPI